MYIEQPLQHYLDDLASAQPTPGGGSASALSGALAAALASMVARMTQGKSGYDTVQARIEHIISQTEQLRARFQQFIEEDIAAYQSLSAAYKMPRGTDEERAARTQAIQTRLLDAVRVPLAMVTSAAQLSTLCRDIAEIGNANLLSDILVSMALLTGAAEGAAAMVRINLRAMKNAELVQLLEPQLTIGLQKVAEAHQMVKEFAGRRM